MSPEEYYGDWVKVTIEDAKGDITVRKVTKSWDGLVCAVGSAMVAHGMHEQALQAAWLIVCFLAPDDEDVCEFPALQRQFRESAMNLINAKPSDDDEES